MKAQEAAGNRTAFVWLGIFIALMLPFCFLGYGPDNDTYGVIDSGRAVWLHHILQTSRTPGYWAYEALIFVLDRIGRFVMTNVATLAVSAVLLWRFYVIAGRLGVWFRLLVTACMAAVPVYLIASTTTMDYVWSMLGLLLMAEFLAEDRWGWATAAGTFAYLIRGANCLVIAGMIAGAVLYELWSERKLTARMVKVLGVGLAAAVVGSLPFIASYRAAGNSMAFTQGMIGPSEMWTLKMRVGRFLYKAILLFSLPGWLVVAWSLVVPKREVVVVNPAVMAYRERMAPMLVGGVLANAVLFFKFSVEISYLLPGAGFLLLLLGMTTLAKSRMLPAALLATLLLASVVTLRLAQPNVPGRSTNAKLHFGLEEGQMIEATQDRMKVRHCDTNDCWGRMMYPEAFTGPQKRTP